MNLNKCKEHEENFKQLCNSQQCNLSCLICTQYECRRIHLHSGSIKTIPIELFQQKLMKAKQQTNNFLDKQLKDLKKKIENTIEEIYEFIKCILQQSHSFPNRIKIMIQKKFPQKYLDNTFQLKQKFGKYVYQCMKDQTYYQKIQIQECAFIKCKIKQQMNKFQQITNFFKKFQQQKLYKVDSVIIGESVIKKSQEQLFEKVQKILNQSSIVSINKTSLVIKKDTLSFFKKLQNTESMKILKLQENQLSDINFLNNINLKDLEELNLFNNQISNLEPLRRVNFSKIKKISLHKNRIIDLTPLIECKFEHLNVLTLSSNLIISVQPLSKVQFYDLKYLFLPNNQIENVFPLFKAKFTDLKELYLQNNKILPILFEQIQSQVEKRFKRCKVKLKN